MFIKNIVKSKVRFIFLVITASVLITGFTACNSSKVEKKDTELNMNSAVVQGKLDNGLSYYVMKNSEPKNRIALRMAVKTGSCMEEDDQKGVAHFIEHLAFNGTENFEKNSIVDFFELIGMDFGADLNAYTSFEETVYQLEIPADNPELLQKAMLIFHDWASSITFDEEEIEKESGVVVEEWRLRRGLNGRVSDALIDFFLDDSQFEKRIPIGDMDVIKNISRERILDYYKKWYRPEFISIIVVGDCDTELMEKTVIEVMKDIPASDKSVELPVFRVPPRTEKAVYTLKDPEQVTTIAEILLQNQHFEPRHTRSQFIERVEAEIVEQIIDQRLSEITLDADSPWLNASIAGFSYTNYDYFSGLAFVPKEGMYTEALKKLLNEYDRLVVFGVTESELKRAKESILSACEQKYSTRETIKSGAIIDSIVNQVVTGKTYLSPDDLYKLEKEAVNSIKIEAVNEYIKSFFADRGMSYFNLTGENTEIPSKEEIMDIWKNYKSDTELQAYVDNVSEDDLMKKPSQKAAIVSKTYIEELGATEYVLSNGLTFYTKITDFEKNTIRVKAISKGGSDLYSDDEYPSIIFSPTYTVMSGIGSMDYNQLSKALSALNISLGLSINSHDEVFNGSAPEKDMEQMLQLISLIMAAPNFTDTGWNQVMLNANNQAKNYNTEPEDVFNEKIVQLLYGKTLKHSQVSPEFVSKMNKNISERIFKERFGNAADFAFIFTGDFNEENIVDLCCTYLGNIPGDENAREETVYEPYNFPKGITKETVYKGVENKGKVFIGFGGNLSAAENVEQIWHDSEMMEMLGNILDIKLREVLREDKGGTYGVSVNTNIDGYPERFYEVYISFGCEPEREEELAEEVIKQIKVMQNELVSQTNIDKLTETYKRTFETNQRNNHYWINMINSTKVLKYLPLSAATDDVSVPSWTTAEALRDLANKYMDTENYVCVYLKPEQK